MDMKELRELGRQQFGKVCRMCPVCDGRACAGEVPGAGGVGQDKPSAIISAPLRKLNCANVLFTA